MSGLLTNQLDPDNEIFELRNYAIAAGRLDDMRRRFRDCLLALFASHGIPFTHCWDGDDEVGSPIFVYLLRWPSWAQRMRSWRTFYADPQWHVARARTNAGSELVERMDVQLLRRFHVAAEPASALPRHLCVARVKIGRGAHAQQFVSELVLRDAFLEAAYEVVVGDDLPRLLLQITARTIEAADAAISAIRHDSLIDVVRRTLSVGAYGEPSSGEDGLAAVSSS